MSVVVKTIARILVPVILVFGAYVILHGHLTPGGGFQGGAVAASSVALLVVAFGAPSVKKLKAPLSTLEDLGATAFVVLGFVGLGFTFLANSLAGTGGLFGSPVPTGPNAGFLNSGGMVPLLNWAVGFKVLGGLGAVMVLFGLFGGDDDR